MSLPMYDFRPVGHVMGRLIIVLGGSMILPLLLDLLDRNGNVAGMVLAAFLTMAAGLALAMSTRQGEFGGLTRPQAFLLTVLVWLVLPVFGALPFSFGAPGAAYVDAYFEAMSGLTTTGATVFTGLDEMPRGMLLWRALLQWFGGLGIVIVAIVFLPMMRIGGMQFFRSESFDLSGDVMPRATEIAASLFYVYLAISIGCVLAYSAAGMTGFDALAHAMTTVSTGGFGTYDSGFENFSASAHYVGILFMWLGALPFIRFVQLARGNTRGILHDSQIRAFLTLVLAVSAVMVVWLVAHDHHPFADAVREALFNVTSTMTGTGYASDPYDQWGALPVALFFVIPLIGGCTGSTSCSAKVFRYQVLSAALLVQIRRIHSPHGVFPLRYQGRPVEPEVVSSIMGYFFVFVCCLSIWSILLSLLGLDTITAISASVASLGNVGPGLGPVVGPSGNYASLPDTAKWLLSLGMLLGRLEFLSVLVLFMPVFWQR
ncbi:MAG TPA: TrkH family potassium uptake protein [Thermohalobaculum sp.]|nr:TrkH family potassium uptake protein [Thermohalobaculum sp.]